MAIVLEEGPPYIVIVKLCFALVLRGEHCLIAAFANCEHDAPQAILQYGEVAQSVLGVNRLPAGKFFGILTADIALKNELLTLED